MITTTRKLTTNDLEALVIVLRKFEEACFDHTQESREQDRIGIHFENSSIPSIWMMHLKREIVLGAAEGGGIVVPMTLENARKVHDLTLDYLKEMVPTIESSEKGFGTTVPASK